MTDSSERPSGGIFISYRRQEASYAAGWLYDRLSERFGREQIFKDVDSIELGSNFVDEITQAVTACEVILVLIGPKWASMRGSGKTRRLDDPNDFVRLEVSAALSRGVRLIPVLVEGASMPAADDLPADLAKLVQYQALQLDPARFRADTDQLLAVLERSLQPSVTAPPSDDHLVPPVELQAAPQPATVSAATRRMPSRPRPQVSSVLFGSAAVALLITVLVGIFGGRDSVSATAVEKARAYVQPAVAYINVQWSGYVYDKFNKQYLNNGNAVTAYFYCTGFAVNPDGYIATEGVCVQPTDEVDINLRKAAATLAIESRYYKKGITTDQILPDLLVVDEAGDKNPPKKSIWIGWGVDSGSVEPSRAYPATVARYRRFDSGDAALLKIDADDLQTIQLSDQDPQIGQKVVQSGYTTYVADMSTLKSAPLYKVSEVSEKNRTGAGYKFSDPLAFSGGGPTVDASNRVVGFGAAGGQVLREVKSLRQLLKQAGVPNKASSTGKAYTEGIDAYFSGDRDSAVESLQTVLDEQPTNQAAREFIRKARVLEGGSNALPVLLGLLSVGLCVGAVVVRRREGSI